MPLLLFRDVCLLSFMVSVRRLWRSSWTISPFMEPPLTTVSTILIKFCRDAKKQTWCSIWRSATSWLTKGSFLVTRFPRGELKWTRRRLKLFKGCPIQGTSKVFVIFNVMLVSTNLLQKDVPFVFDEDFKEAFEVFKKALITSPI